MITMAKEIKDSGLIKFLGGLLLGAALGYFAGLMLSDRSGSDLRKDWLENSNHILANMKDKLEDFKEKASIKIQEIKNFADEKFSLSAIKIQDQISSIGRQLDELGKKSQDFINDSRENTANN
jgi:gas vesicle protein